MQYLEFFTTIPTGTVTFILCASIFLLMMMLSEYYHHEEGLLPRLTKRVERLADRFVAQLAKLQHALTGDTLGVPEDFFANEEAFQKAAQKAAMFWQAIVLASFTVSYSALVELSVWLGFEGVVPYLIPLIIDAIIIACIKTIEAYARTGESDLLAHLGVIVYTFVSIVLNIAHLAWNRDLSILIFLGGVAAPMGIWLCTEQISRITRKMTYRQGVQRNTLELSGEITERKAEISRLEERLEAVQADLAMFAEKEKRLHELNGTITELEEGLAKLDDQFIKRLPDAPVRVEQAKLLVSWGLTQEHISQLFNIGSKTSRQYERMAKEDLATSIAVPNGR